VKLPPPNCVSSFGFVTTTLGEPGVCAGAAVLGMSTVSCTTSVVHAFVASKLHASGANGDARQAWRITEPLAELTQRLTFFAPPFVLPLAGFASQHMTRGDVAA